MWENPFNLTERSTIWRFLSGSRHVLDLLVILAIAFFFLIIAVPTTLITWLIEGKQWDALAVLGGELAIFGSIIAWCYQTAAQRLGVVDLFGCEISAIFRVYIVVGFAEKLAEVFDAESLAQGPSGEQPIESYTPVMDRVTSELQVLDADVVSNTTEFYTYRRAMMDYLMRAGHANDIARRRYFIFQTIYMLFLSAESGRKAVRALIEYEPDRAESLINIMITELICYQFLTARIGSIDFGRVPSAVREARLHLRLGEYRSALAERGRDIEKGKAVIRAHPDSSEARSWQRSIETFSVVQELCAEIGMARSETVGPVAARRATA